MSIMHIDAPGFPWFHFEWHPSESRGYIIRQARDASVIVKPAATPFSEPIRSEKEMNLAVQAFLAGYQAHADEPTLFRGNGPRHHRMFIEHGNASAKVNGGGS